MPYIDIGNNPLLKVEIMLRWHDTFADLRRIGVTLTQWLAAHQGHASECIAPLPYDEWVRRLKTGVRQ